jgi:hypothetical protein
MGRRPALGALMQFSLLVGHSTNLTRLLFCRLISDGFAHSVKSPHLKLLQFANRVLYRLQV